MSDEITPEQREALAAWHRGEGAFLKDLPTTDERCPVKHKGGGLTGSECGYPLLIDGYCVNQANHLWGVRPPTDPRGRLPIEQMLANAGNPAAQFMVEYGEEDR